jgi:DNA-binding NarL/FixJ family response regulator
MDADGEFLLYDKFMIRAYIADSLPEERSALRLLLLDLDMDVVGEAADWLTTFQFAPESKLNMLLVEWNLLPPNANAVLAALRAACPNPLAIVLISHLDARKQAALSCGADAFISKSETPERVAERLQAAAESLMKQSGFLPRQALDTQKNTMETL